MDEVPRATEGDDLLALRAPLTGVASEGVDRPPVVGDLPLGASCEVDTLPFRPEPAVILAFLVTSNGGQLLAHGPLVQCSLPFDSVLRTYSDKPAEFVTTSPYLPTLPSWMVDFELKCLACCAPANKGTAIIPPIAVAAVMTAIARCTCRLLDGLGEFVGT